MFSGKNMQNRKIYILYGREAGFHHPRRWSLKFLPLIACVFQEKKVEP